MQLNQIRRSREMKIVRSVLLRQQEHVKDAHAQVRKAATFSITSGLLNQSAENQINDKF